MILMTYNYLYKCTDCNTVQAHCENIGLSTWLLSCQSIRCQGMIKECFRLDISVIAPFDICPVVLPIVCEKEVLGDGTDEIAEEKINVHRSVDQ